MRLIIAGSRDFGYGMSREERLRAVAMAVDALEDSLRRTVALVISGGAKGADAAGEEYADCLSIPCIVMPAEWGAYGKRAGYIRNERMAEQADAVLALWDGESRGTKHMLDIARRKGLPALVFHYKEGRYENRLDTHSALAG